MTHSRVYSHHNGFPALFGVYIMCLVMYHDSECMILKNEAEKKINGNASNSIALQSRFFSIELLFSRLGGKIGFCYEAEISSPSEKRHEWIDD